MMGIEKIVGKLIKRIDQHSLSQDYLHIKVKYDEIVKNVDADTLKELNKNLNKAIMEIKARLQEKLQQVYIEQIPEIEVSIVDLPEYSDATGFGIVKLANIRKKHIGKYIGVRGIATTVVQPTLFPRVKTYVCKKCGTVVQQQKQGLFDEYDPPKVGPDCPNEACGGRSTITRDESRDEYRDTQLIILQEPPAESGLRQAVKIPVVLYGSAVNTVKLMHQVLVYGTVKVLPAPTKGAEAYKYYIDACAVEEEGLKYKETTLTKEDIEMVEELIKKDKDIIRNMAKSLIPYIRIPDIVRIALLLQQIRGIPLKIPGAVEAGDVIHIAWLGDPGVAKSATGRRIASICPGAQYILGSRASKAGVGLMVDRDPLTNEWRLVVGAIPMANGSTAVFDEFDKINPDVADTLLQVLSQQSCKIDMGSIHEEVSANTSLLFLLNPRSGLRLATSNEYPADLLPPTFSPAFRSRIDLFLVTPDKPDLVEDTKTAEHFIALYSGQEKAEIAEPPPYPDDVLRKYIEYARNIDKIKNTRIELTKEAGDYIKEYYISLRKLALIEGMPTTIDRRRLETIIKLSGAFAKALGSTKIKEEHAKMAIELYTAMLKMWRSDIGGIPDVDALEGIPKKRQDEIRITIKYFKEKDPEKKGIPRQQVIEDLKKMGVQDPEKILAQLKKAGEIIEPVVGKTYSLA